jgi:hypothetical protein
MTALDERPVRAGRRKSDASSASVFLPKWLDAPLLPTEEPRDGSLIDPQAAGPGDYVLEFHESTGTASWLRILAPVAVVDGAALVTCGRGSGVTLSFAAGRQVWALRRSEAGALASAASDRVLRSWGGREDEMERLLRSFTSRSSLVKGWPFGAESLADALTAWDLLRDADAANSTDVPPTVGAVAR